MREHKFRARALDEKLGLIYFKLHETGPAYTEDEVFYVNGTPCQWGTEEQFMGQRDKNGTEVYEGDVVQTYMSGHEGPICEVIYDTRGFCMKAKGDKNEMDYIWYNVFEVIGNIYSNPELLKEDSQ